MRAIQVPAEGDVAVVDWDETNPEQWYTLVDGDGVDFITMRENALQIIVDHHSMLNGKPQNQRVTWFLKGTGRWLSEVRGTVLIVGITPDSGMPTDVPDMLAEVLSAPAM